MDGCGLPDIRGDRMKKILLTLFFMIIPMAALADVAGTVKVSGTAGLACKMGATVRDIVCSTNVPSVTSGKTVSFSKSMTFTAADDTGAYTLPTGTKTIPSTGDNLSVFASTTSSQLAGVISDETGTAGKVVFDTSPTLVTPTLGVASATTINKVTLTAPATGSTLTIADGKTLTVSKTMTLTSAGDSAVLTLPNTTTSLLGSDNQILTQLRPQAGEPPAASFATIFSRNSHPALSFDGDVCIAWTFVLPSTYQGGGVTVDFWTVSSGTANDLDWDGSWERIDTAQDIDSDSFATAVSADNNNNDGTSGIATQVAIAFTDGAQMDSCAAGELCRFRLCRDATSDTTANTNGLAVYIGGQIRETP